MSVRLNLDRLAVHLHGVARPVAEAALDGLGQELGRRLARTPLSTLPTGDVLRIDLRDFEVSDPRDVAALRDAIAASIVTGLTGHRQRVPLAGEEAK